MFSKKGYSRAQGTIEYLVILAVIIVVSLIVVALVANLSTGQTQTISAVGTKIGMSMGAVSITEAVNDVAGNAAFKLMNASGENLTILDITIGSTTNAYDATTLVSGDAALFSLTDLNVSCPCVGDAVVQTCIVNIRYLTANSIEKITSYPVAVTCLPTLTVRDAGALISPITQGTTGACGSANAVTFAYEDTSYAGTSTTQCARGTPSATTFPTTGGAVSWTCSGQNGGNASSTCVALRADTTATRNAHPIANCSDLNAVRDHVDWNYVLLNDVDCASTVSWNSGTGFAPIEDNFVGVLDGNSHRITNLFISGSGYRVALFANLYGTVKNLGLVDINVLGTGGSTAAAAVSVTASNEKISNVYATGTVATINRSWNTTIAFNTYSGSRITNVYSDINFPTGSLGLLGSTVIGGDFINSFAVSRIGSSGGLWWDFSDPVNMAIYLSPTNTSGGCHIRYGADTNAGCTIITDATGGRNYFYTKTHEPIASFGTWVNVSGTLWRTSNGVWSICEGQGLPWLSNENRTCS